MRKLSVSFFLLFVQFAPVQAQPFSHFLSLGTNSQFPNTSFVNCHQLRNQQGYLLLAERYVTVRNAMVIRTDSMLNEIWATSLNFQQAQPPYDNINFFDIGELLNGNYYVFGMAGTRYVIFVLDTNGQVINHTAVYDTMNVTSVGNYAQLHIGFDSSLIIGFSEYERFGFYRLDQNLNVLSSGFYTSGSGAWGRDCILLPDTTLLISWNDAVSKVSLNGTLIWSKAYPGIQHIKTLYADPGGSIYIGGSSANNPAGVLGKCDAAGNPVFFSDYQMSPGITTSPPWNIYANGNGLMIYSDSIMFPLDTMGNVTNFGKVIYTYNFKFLKPADPGFFLLTGNVYQSATQDWEYSVMKFSDTTQSGCLYPRSVIRIPVNITPQNVTPVVQTGSVAADTINFNAIAVLLDYDVLPGCPPHPMGAGEQHPDPGVAGAFPNPANDAVTFSLGPHKAPLAAEIIDCNGRIVFAARADGQELRVNVENFAAGIYLFRVQDENGNTAGLRFCVTH